MKTYSPSIHDIVNHWHVLDADQAVLGRLASRVARVLQGKHKPIYTPHIDTGDHVIIVNAEKIRVTGKKAEHKVYNHHTGYPGGLKTRTYSDLQESKPDEIVRLAIRRMMPKTKLGRQMMRKLKIYVGPDHPHQAQNPQPLELESI
ncbi:MAG: 50S ribosomal protein L13 [Planctomycetota bacterium]|jgi:large subunit ribosomal protein L13|nr:50S ribosomal protein L13 [Planctomycetota bacterium]